MKNRKIILLILFVLCVNSFVLKSQEYLIEIETKRNTDNSVDFNYRKNCYGTYCIQFTFRQLSNSFQSNFQSTVSGLSGRAISLKPRDATQGIGFSFSYIYQLGSPNVKINDDFIYLLPFRNDVKLEAISLNNLNRSFGKGVSETWKAYRFVVENPESIVACRKGLVVKVVDEFNVDTTQNFNYKRSQNEVIVEHKDGTLARYSGFKAGSIKVEEGQMIYPYSEIGIVGRNGKDVNYKLDLCIYYLNTKNLNDFNDIVKKANALAYVNPKFNYKGAAATLLSRNKYVTECNDEIITQEFSRREKKKYLKGELK